MGGNGEGVFYMNKKDNIYKRETDIDGKYLDNINHVRRNGYKRNIQKEILNNRNVSRRTGIVATGIIIGFTAVVMIFVVIGVHRRNVNKIQDNTQLNNQSDMGLNENNKNDYTKVDNTELDSDNDDKSQDELEKDKAVNAEMERSEAGMAKNSSSQEYFLIIKDHRVNIYRNEDKQFYDFADINISGLPDEVEKQLEYGLVIKGEQELYDFLQTYSS